MKRTRIVSIILASAVVVGFIPFAVFLASAIGELRASGEGNTVSVSPAERPTVMPDATAIGKVETFVDVSTLNAQTHADRGTHSQNADGTLKYTAGQNTEAGRNGLGYGSINNMNSTDPIFEDYGTISASNSIGASGIMFYFDNGTATKGFVLSFGVRTSRGQFENGVDRQMFFDSTVRHFVGDAAQTIDGEKCKYYVYDGNAWAEKSTDHYFIGGGQSGAMWYYIPFESFYYHGSWNVGDDGSAKSYDPDAYGISYDHFRNHCEGVTGMDIASVQIKVERPTERTVDIGDLYFVYPELAGNFENAVSCEYLPNIKLHDLEPNTDDEVTKSSTFTGKFSAYVDSENSSVTVTGDTENNTTDKSDGRAWFESTAATTRDMTRADGIRFNIDTSGVPDTNLLLRIRLKEGLDANELVGYTLLTNDANGKTTPQTDLNVQYVLRSAGSVIYLRDEGAEKWTPYWGNDANLRTEAAYHSDTVAIPQGFVGEVYIPMDSFFASLGSWGSKLISWDAAVNEAGLGKLMDYIAIVQTYEAPTESVDSYYVTYSDFRIVYEDIALTESHISLGKDITFKLDVQLLDDPYAEITYQIDGGMERPVDHRAVDGGYEISVKGIQPEDAGKLIRFNVRGRVGDIEVSCVYETSIKEHCQKLLRSEVSAEAKALAADLLRYADAYQRYIGEHSEPVIDSDTEALISGIGSNAAAPTGGKSRQTDTTVGGCTMTDKALYIDSSLSLKVGVTLSEGKTAKLEYSIDGDEEVRVEVRDGIATVPVGAGELNRPIRLVLYVDGVAVQSCTYYVSDYFAQALTDASAEGYEVTRALYNYCYSADAYRASLEQ